MTITKNKDMEVLDTRNYKAGYVVCREKHYVGTDDDEVIIRAAYTPEGLRIGDVKTARYLIIKRGIKPEYASKSSNICTVGFCEKDRKWYGWSHRAICGFSIGDRIFEEKYGDNDTPFIKHGKIPVVNQADQRKAAVEFAKSVS